MAPFLESYGTEKAERCLAEFMSAVRRLGQAGLSDRSKALLGEERTALLRRIANAEKELGAQNAVLASHANRLCNAVATAQRAMSAANVDHTDLRTLVRDLHDAIPAHEVEQRSLRRAAQWLSDLKSASDRLADRLADDTSPEAPSDTVRGVVRAISEVSVALDAMTVTTRASREEHEEMRNAAGGDLRLAAVLRNPLLSGEAVEPRADDADPSDLLHHLMRDLARAGQMMPEGNVQLKKLN